VSEPINQLLWEIADCDELRRCRARPDEAHPCQAIVDLQADRPWQEHQRPEPWNGDFGSARILFVSSNPSIDRSEPYPAGASGRAEVERFFPRRFEEHIADGTRPRKLGGVPAARPVPYLNEVLGIASDLLGRVASPGVDYALTEVVHCKSAGRQGLERRRGRPGALERCPALYLRRIVDASGSRLVVAVGADARRALIRELSLAEDFGLLARGGRPLVPVSGGSDGRYCLAIGGISSSDRRDVLDERVLSHQDLERIRQMLA
jgi:hypothetical protein